MNRYKNHVLEHADRQGYATPAFNYSDIWEYEAIVQAAIEERAVVYTATNMRVAETIGLPYLGALGAKAYEQTGGQILNHLDHSRSVELCKQAVDCGYHSVMIDASMCSLEENIEKTCEVVEYAHKHGVVVEAEIGRILGRNVEGTYQGEDYLVQVEDAVRLAQKTHVDSLAIGIGTAHGFYKEKPNINIERLQQVNAAIDTPLVLHGGTGVPFDTVRACIQNGMAKVNFGTQLHATYIDTLKKELTDYQETDIAAFMIPVRSAIQSVVQSLIQVCGAENRFDG
ncbi:class II fructose-bisphosphate aldolase [Butyricicoccus faecihominis]|uniref:class II fructose-bisphosphate aldolase n=1 Tax=Butyricicoccus faecihominis TaxID=1712515 RepID=UPI002479C110|nr:class II fructose-bisphosphate aldolase [Butyricicoccus faecihominis]MCQ5130092.1 class II fructose-bisphosphate aldolase [Butyricicoccus faecihominis]